MTLWRPARVVAPVLSLVAFGLPAGAAPPADIAAIAPAKSLIVVGTPSFKALSESLHKTELGKLWDEPAVKSFVEDVTRDRMKELGEILKEVDATAADLHPPEGQAGFALFLPESAPKAGRGSPGPDPYMLVAADMGEHAGDYEKLLERVVEKGVKDKEITSESDTYAGTPVTVLKPVIDEKTLQRIKERAEKMRRGGGEEEEEAGEAGKVSEFAAFFGGALEERRAMRIARVGNLLVAGTEQHAFEDALDALKGKAIDSFAESSIYRQSMDQHAPGGTAFAVVNLEEILGRTMATGETDFGVAPGKIFEALGFTGVKAASASLRFDSADGMLDASIGALVPEKKGLLELISTPLGAFEPPDFAPADAAGLTRLSFSFGRIFDVVRSAIAAMPESERSQAAPQVEIARDMTQQALAVMGPGVSIVSAYSRPLGAESSNTTFAIDATDAEAVSNTFTALAGKAQGLMEPHEFEGNQTYKLVLGRGGVTFGLGFGKVFIGGEDAVHGAMRLAGHHEGAGLAQSAQFKQATRSISPGAVMYSWTDMEQTLRWEYWSLKNQVAMVEQALANSPIDPEQREQMIKSMKAAQPEWLDKLPAIETVTAHVGDMVSELRATPEGFRGRVLMVRPTEKK
jgi:hypothetical protein